MQLENTPIALEDSFIHCLQTRPQPFLEYPQRSWGMIHMLPIGTPVPVIPSQTSRNVFLAERCQAGSEPSPNCVGGLEFGNWPAAMPPDLRKGPSVSIIVRHRLAHSLVYEGDKERSHVNTDEFSESARFLGGGNPAAVSLGGE